MIAVYLVRHSMRKRHNPIIPNQHTPLTEEGIVIAREEMGPVLGKDLYTFLGEHPGAEIELHMSPARRVFDTWQAMQPNFKELHIMPKTHWFLRDKDKGKLHGVSAAERAERFGEFVRENEFLSTFTGGEMFIRSPGGESGEDVRARVYDYLRPIKTAPGRAPHQVHIFVTHGLPCKLIRENLCMESLGAIEEMTHPMAAIRKLTGPVMFGMDDHGFINAETIEKLAVRAATAKRGGGHGIG